LLSLSSKLRLQPASRDLTNDQSQTAKKKKADVAVRAMMRDMGRDDNLLAGMAN
jgi:hypothetical protein